MFIFINTTVKNTVRIRMLLDSFAKGHLPPSALVSVCCQKMSTKLTD